MLMASLLDSDMTEGKSEFLKKSCHIFIGGVL